MAFVARFGGVGVPGMDVLTYGLMPRQVPAAGAEVHMTGRFPFAAHPNGWFRMACSGWQDRPADR